MYPSALSLAAVILSAIPAVFAALFLIMFHRDNDKRKLVGSIAFAFMSASSAVEIFGLPQSFYFLSNLYWWGDLPIVSALILFFLSQMFNLRNFEKAFKIFFVVFGVTLLIILIPVPNVEVVSKAIVDFSGVLAISSSVYLFIKRRLLVDALFFLCLLSFDAYGYSWGTNLGLAFSLTCYAASFLFIGLALGYVRVESSWDSASVFKVTKQLNEAKERLKELESDYKTIFESANDAILVADVQTGVILDCNCEATNLLEIEKGAIVGKNENTLFPLQCNVLTASFINNASGASEVIELQVATNKGKVKDVTAKLRSFQHGGKKLLVGVLRDVTEQKRNALDLSNALEDISNQKDKVESLNEKLKVISGLTRHDVRNKLMVANSNVYILKKRIGNQPDLTEYLSGVESAIKQCDRLFEVSRLFEKIGMEELTEISVADCFNQAASLVAKPGIEVINDCQGLTVTADTMLTQLFYNLIDNSQKHGGSVTKINIHYQKDNEKTILFYEDNGVGIAEGNKKRIFSEGYTTGGSGLGLKLVKKLIETYGWTIQENGIHGVGARFQINIPPAKIASSEQVNFVPNLQSTPWCESGQK